jgi:hypothetical protein
VCTDLLPVRRVFAVTLVENPGGGVVIVEVMLSELVAVAAP